MTYRTHVTFGFAASFSTALIPLEKLNPFFYINEIYLLPIIFGLVFVSSLAPDFDEPGSYLSKRFPWFFISYILSSFTTHRGVTHYAISSLIYTIVVFSIAYYFLRNEIFEYLFLIPFVLIPYLFHSIGDGFTKGGVKRFFFPFSKKTFWFLPKSMRFYTESFTENIYFMIFSGIFIFEMYYLLFIQKIPIAKEFISMINY